MLADAKAVRKLEGLVPKSLGKIASDERLWDAYLEEHPMPAKAKYPPKEHVVRFAAWTTRNDGEAEGVFSGPRGSRRVLCGDFFDGRDGFSGILGPLCKVPRIFWSLY